MVLSFAMIRCVLMFFSSGIFGVIPGTLLGLTMAAFLKHHLFSDLCGSVLFALVLLCRAFLHGHLPVHRFVL